MLQAPGRPSIRTPLEHTFNETMKPSTCSSPCVALLPAAAVLLLLIASPVESPAQTDYYNTDRNRPVRIEDAHTVDRYAFELKVASLRIERSAGGVYQWEFAPEIAYGILPRTSVEVGVPLVGIDAAGETRRGLAGLELSVFHNLNVETASLPAFAVRGDVLLPVGGLAADRAYPSLTAITTRTFQWGRLHANAQYTFGRAFGEGASDGEHAVAAAAHEPRWLAGVAVDRSSPLQSLLVIGNVYAAQPLDRLADLQWHAEAGVRYQLSPYLAVDAGAGRRFGQDAWYVTAGGAYHVALRKLIPLPR